MTSPIPAEFLDMLAIADRSWRPVLKSGLAAIADTTPDYLPQLAQDDFLPTNGRLFAAFAQPLDAVRFVLYGEGPYPRPESATGVCFMDGAVGALWSEKGLSRQVNRATSLRNFMKMLLVAAGRLQPDNTSGDAMTAIAHEAHATSSPYIQTLANLQANLIAQGFLLLNASLVFRTDVAPQKDAKAWLPFQQIVLQALLQHAEQAGRPAPTLVLWGKIAEQLRAIPASVQFPKAIAEHPYNLTFIHNAGMQALFAPMHLLMKQ